MDIEDYKIPSPKWLATYTLVVIANPAIETAHAQRMFGSVLTSPVEFEYVFTATTDDALEAAAKEEIKADLTTRLYCHFRSPSSIMYAAVTYDGKDITSTQPSDDIPPCSVIDEQASMLEIRALDSEV